MDNRKNCFSRRKILKINHVRWITVICASIFLCLSFFCAPGNTKTGPKVLIVIDMDGATGVAKFANVLSQSPGYQTARESLTEDVNAAIRGLFRAGASEVVLTDAHGSGSPVPDDRADSCGFHRRRSKLDARSPWFRAEQE